MEVCGENLGCVQWKAGGGALKPDNGQPKMGKLLWAPSAQLTLLVHMREVRFGGRN